MTVSAIDTEMRHRQNELAGNPVLRPNWLHPLSATAVIAAHIAFFVSFMFWARPQVAAIGPIDAQLVREGDFFDAEAVSEADVHADDPSLSEIVEEPELALPPPLIMTPEAEPLPARTESSEQAKKNEKDEKKRAERRDVESANERREAQARRRAGAPGGRGQGSGGSAATCLAHVAASLRRNMPASTSLGPGTAYVTFHVNAGGGISGVSVSASTSAHAALARRIVAASRGPASCGATFVSQHITFQ